MTNTQQPLRFYQFLACHSLLIGLLPFYLPTFLWGLGVELAGICLLIGVSGLSFCVALRFWQPVSKSNRPRSVASLFVLTFVLECILVVVAIIQQLHPVYIIALGIFNGLYNAFFWTTQRTLFLQMLGSNDSGRQYGNFQIFVSLFLKIGILIGGWLLGQSGALGLLIISIGIGVLASIWFYLNGDNNVLHDTETITLRESIEYRDKHNSQPVFIADGFFLFLESHFWTLSLFLVVEEDYARLGLVVVVLAVVFGVLFFILKNTIDKIAGQFVFKLAVCLYAASWALRVFANGELPAQWLLALLVSITFFSSFFRLAFNKRFFDIATSQQGVHYLLIKSYVTQFWVGIGFLLLAVILWLTGPTVEQIFTSTYLLASILSFIYLCYRIRPANKQ